MFIKTLTVSSVPKSPQEFTYTFTDEERHGLILRLDLLVKYLNQDLTILDDKIKVLIETTQDLRKKIEYSFR